MGPDLHVDTLITAVLMVALLPLAMLPALGVVVRRYGRLPAWPLLSAVGLLGAGCALAAFTVFPLPQPGQVACTGEPFTSTWQLTPLGSILPIGDAVESGGFLGALAGFAFLQVALNVLLFVPYGFFLHQVTRWRGAAVILVSGATSLLIELTQGTALFGIYPCPYRLFDVDDLLLNTAGGAVGLALSRVVARAAFANPVATPDLAPPGVTRRAAALMVDLLLVGTATFVASAALLEVLAARTTLAHAERVLAEPVVTVLLGLAAGAAVVLMPSLLTRDRTTPGQLLLDVAPAVADGAARPPLARVVLRWAVRWATWGIVPSLLPVVLVAELLTVIARRDRRSLSDLVSGTTMVTRTALRSVQADATDASTAAGAGTMRGPGGS
ncbi:VanZ family protein [Demequina silvatica]|uniref:VanZ family protein n=1 Tax=Demequina silvatica TaxID=1638988 RepID=UPI000781AC7B|nr:VanZ family protein [Demequina silvatica]